MTAKEAADLMDVLIAKAPGLRASGVLALELGEVKAQLMPPDGTAPDNQKPVTRSGDPLKDHALYSMGPGEKLPGYDFEPDE